LRQILVQQDQAADGVGQLHDLQLVLVEIAQDVTVVWEHDLGLERRCVCRQCCAHVIASGVCPVGAGFGDPTGIQDAEFDVDGHQHDPSIFRAGFQCACRLVCGLHTGAQLEDRKRGHDQ